ncbi:MAG: hypothetical protein C0432_04145 [Candidatus Puniceispirillum sp.]|nr:hypothetical protein [Candidatus Pelagibacter sp.]MBA4283466.1 hypothetical protein [Candidatus Puniceispirillum sp.]
MIEPNRDFSAHSEQMRNSALMDQLKMTSKSEESEDNKKIKGWDFRHHIQRDSENSLHTSLNKTAADQVQFAQKILLQQLKHQFPGNEFDATKMVESMMNMLQIAQNGQLNETQHKNLELNRAMINNNLAMLQGRTIEFKSDKFDYSGGEQQITLVSPEPALIEYSIYREGEESPVFQGQMRGEMGSNYIKWDGLDKNGEAQPTGIYQVYAAAKNEHGSDVEIEKRVASKITTIDYDSGSLGIPFAGSLPVYNLNRLLDMVRPHFDSSEVQSKEVTN